MKSFLRSTLNFYETEKMVLCCSLLLASMMKRCASVIIVDSIGSSNFRFQAGSCILQHYLALSMRGVVIRYSTQVAYFMMHT
jgi:hypothetical protein